MNTALIPEEIVQIGESLIRFVDQEIAPIEQANKALLASDRTIYDEHGRFTPEIEALKKTVRMKIRRGGILHDVRAGGAWRRRPRAGGGGLSERTARDPLRAGTHADPSGRGPVSLHQRPVAAPEIPGAGSAGALPCRSSARARRPRASACLSRTPAQTCSP